MEYWKKVEEIYLKQRKKGIESYGKTLEQNTIPDIFKRLEYIEEELVDALMYIEWVKDVLKDDN